MRGQGEGFDTQHMTVTTTVAKMPSIVSGRESILLVNNSANTIYYAHTQSKCNSGSGGIIPPTGILGMDCPAGWDIFFVATAGGTDLVITEFA